MTRGEYEQLSLKYWQHYQHACEKHPFFADAVMYPHPLEVIEGASDKWKNITRKHNQRTISLFKSIAKGKKKLRNTEPSAENVLDAELCEIWLAAAEDNLEQAHYEIADAIAVLIRLDEQLEELHQRQLNPSAYKDK
ncbi:MAG: hypothetical protein IJS08_12320, partial [Victivallales bacterium]|nr:hypothetical protein [Victivallales bacterium]